MSGPPNKTERAQDTIFPVGKVDSQWKQNWCIYLLVHASSLFPAANLLQELKQIYTCIIVTSTRS